PQTAPADTSGRIGSTQVAIPPNTLGVADPAIRSQRREILNLMRPVRTGSYAVSAPANPPTSTVEMQRAAILQQLRPPGPLEDQSAKCRAPFDTAAPGSSATTAAEQLLQAADAGNGCIDGIPSQGAGTVAIDDLPIGSGTTAPGKGIESGGGPGQSDQAVSGTTRTQTVGQVCGVKVAFYRPVSLLRANLGPGRASGYPIASTLDQLVSFDPGDISANLATMSPQELAAMKGLARQNATSLEVAIEHLRIKLTREQFRAASPVKTLDQAAVETIIESLKAAVPFWLAMEDLGQSSAGSGHESAVEPIDQAEDAISAQGFAASLVDWLDGVAAQSTASKIVRASAQSFIEIIRAAEAASQGSNGAAVEHLGKAANASWPLTEILVPESAVPTLAKSQGYLEAALIIIELGTRAYDVNMARADAIEAQTAARDLSFELTNHINRLDKKLRDTRFVEQLVAEKLHCS
ncbi:MAG: hypothetical protein ACE5OQ_13210, partial [Woeseia sp.]